ncbi:hypothetical protein HYS92_02550 [Candidatus Daviesbacteria bacterium]|nr:hypothetical protein [Candidatus Daviesbacteria bacterium]
MNPQKVKHSQILGGIVGGFDELGFEMEASLKAAPKAAGSILEAVFDLGQDIAGVEAKTEAKAPEKFPPQGTIEFNQKVKEMEEDKKQKEEAGAKRIFFQALKEETAKVENARDRMIYEEELADIGAHISTEEKNSLLHYQASYKDRSTYQMAELRRKLVEQRQKSDKEKKDANMVQTQTKTKSAMQGIFEGSSGTQGGGTANLSSTSGGVG